MNSHSVRRGLLVAAVVAVVAIAGCNGPAGGPTPTADSAGNATETAANTTATPTPATDAATATPAGGVADPRNTTDDSGVNESESDESASNESNTVPETNATGADIDGQALNAATAAAVEDAGSYTLTSDLLSSSQSERGRSRTRITTTTQVDLDAGQGLRVTNQSISSPQGNQNGRTTVYTEGNTSYRERVTREGTNYSTQEGGPDGFRGIFPVNTTGFNQNLAISDGFIWEENTTTTVGGDTVTRYDLAGVEDTSMLTRRPDARLTDVGGTLYIDADGVFRYVSIRYSVDAESSTSSTRAQLTLTDIGSTTVAEPDWTSTAEDAD